MATYTLRTEVSLPYEAALAATRDALAHQGFGVLTEIDLAGTLNAKLGADFPPQTILGACRPVLADQAIQADPGIATVLPCNVVVRSAGVGSVVEALDPLAMLGMSSGALDAVATDARDRLAAALEALDALEALAQVQQENR